jgi:predicted rRNA methylase YqxC with S4 and FtsJ domains
VRVGNGENLLGEQMSNRTEAIEMLANSKMQLVAMEIYLTRLQKVINTNLASIKKQDVAVSRGLLKLRATPEEISKATLSQQTLAQFKF